MWGFQNISETCELLKHKARQQHKQFGPQAIANTLWALATIGDKADAALMAALSRKAVMSADKVGSLSLSADSAPAIYAGSAPFMLALLPFKMTLVLFTAATVQPAGDREHAVGAG